MNLKEIATKAGVSQASVSLVLNNRKGISDEKRKDITKLLLDNGYEINDGDSTGNSTTIRILKIKKHGKLVEENPGFITGIIDSIESECRNLGMELAITNCRYSDIKDAISTFTSSNTDGLIVLATEVDGTDNLDILRTLNIPFIVLDKYVRMNKFSCITMNNTEAVYSSVKFLTELGHKKIGYIANAFPSSNCLTRLNAFKQSHEYFDFEYNDDFIFNINPTLEGSYESIRNLILEGTKFPSAILANNDCIALGAIKAFKEFGIRIPQDISIIGFDNISYSAICEPPLTTNAVSRKQIGRIAMNILSMAIESSNFSPTKILVSTQLLKRESTDKYNPDSDCRYIIK